MRPPFSFPGTGARSRITPPFKILRWRLPAPPDYRDCVADLIEEKYGSHYEFCKATGVDPRTSAATSPSAPICR